MKCPHCGLEHFDDVEVCPSTGSKLSLSERLAGRKVGKYSIVRSIGEGGMGAVFEARHAEIQKKVAIKFLHPRYAHEQEVLRRFMREARTAARIGHENIVEVYDTGVDTETGVSYIVMEHLEGETLQARLEKSGSLAVVPAVDIMLQVLSALHASHTLGIVHRDLKPDNIFLTVRAGRSNWVKILDFGLAKVKYRDGGIDTLTMEGAVLGTPHFMPPEQCEGRQDLDHRVDLYACGVILYLVLTGRYPFDAPNLTGLLYAIANKKAEDPAGIRPEIGRDLSAVIMKAMAREPSERYAGALDMAVELQDFGHRDAVITEEFDRGARLAHALGKKLGFKPDFESSVRSIESGSGAADKKSRFSKRYAALGLILVFIMMTATTASWLISNRLRKAGTARTEAKKALAAGLKPLPLPVVPVKEIPEIVEEIEESKPPPPPEEKGGMKGSGNKKPTKPPEAKPAHPEDPSLQLALANIEKTCSVQIEAVKTSTTITDKEREVILKGMEASCNEARKAAVEMFKNKNGGNP